MKRKPGGKGTKFGISAINVSETLDQSRVNVVLLQSLFESPCKQGVNRDFIHCCRYFVNPPGL